MRDRVLGALSQPYFCPLLRYRKKLHHPNIFSTETLRVCNKSNVPATFILIRQLIMFQSLSLKEVMIFHLIESY